MKELCLLGKEIKKKLVDLNCTQEWLISKVTEDTGLYFDDSYLHKILTGKLAPKKIVKSIKKILEIEVQP